MLSDWISTSAYEAEQRRDQRKRDRIDRASMRVREERDHLIDALQHARDTDAQRSVPAMPRRPYLRYRDACDELTVLLLDSTTN